MARALGYQEQSYLRHIVAQARFPPREGDLPVGVFDPFACALDAAGPSVVLDLGVDRPGQDNVLIGGLSSRALIRLTLEGQQVTSEEQIGMDARIREVAQGPDGAIYLLTDQENGEILRLSPK